MRHITSLLLLCLISFVGKTQSADPSTDILPPNPTAAAITKYVDFPVNTSTGIPSISIPLGAVEANGISTSVSMDYHAGGVKVDEASSIVGLGWSLNAGGAINRTVMGKRDEDADGYMYQGPNIPTYPIGSGAEFTALQAFSNGTWDGQPDVFQFSFANYSGKFVFENNSTIRLIPKQDLKITYTTCSGGGCPVNVETGSIISFTVTTPDGTQYLFGTIDAVESSKTQNANVSGYSGCRPKEFTSPTINSWLLKSITNPKNGEVIDFNYNSYSVSYEASYNESYRFKDPVNTNSQICDNTPTGSKCITTKTENGKILASITSPLGKIEFTPNATRSDVSIISGNYRINKVKIYGRSNQLLKSFQFSQAFIQSTASPSNSAPQIATATRYRMYLDGISEYSSSASLVNSWSFEYWSRGSLPPRLSFKQDHWGFFNNKNNTQLTPMPEYYYGTLDYIKSYFAGFTPANREPDAAYSYYGNLKKITYPTGGFVEYEYEGNEIALCDTVDVQTPASASAALTYTGTYGQTATYSFTVDEGQAVNIGFSVQQHGTHHEGAYAKLNRVSPNPTQILKKGGQLSSPALISGWENHYLTAGSYQIEVGVFFGPMGGGYPSPFDALPESASMSVNYVDMVPTYFYNKPTGGIRIKKATYNAVLAGSNAIVKTYQYNKSAPDCTNASSAVGMGSQPLYVSADYAAATVAEPNGIPCDFEICKKIILSSSSLLNLTNNAGAIVTYRESWESQGLNAENGKKYYKHSIYGDASPNENGWPMFHSVPNIDYSWKNAKVLEEKVLNAQGQTVYQKLYDYEFEEVTNQTATKGFVARKAFNPPCTGTYIYYCDGQNNEGEEYHVVRDMCGLPIELCPIAYTVYYSCYDKPAGYAVTSYDDIAPYSYAWYDHVSQFVYLKQTKERVFNSDGSGNYVETVTDYGYDLPSMTHLMPTKTTVTNSDNSQYITYTKYAPQYTTTTVTDQTSVAIKALKDNFMIDRPIETVQTIKKGATESITGGQIIKFKNFGGTRIMPNETWRVATTSPVALGSFTFSNISGGNFVVDSRYYHTGTLGAYDAEANLLEWNKKDDQVSSFVYGHSLALPIAYVKNALSTEIAFTSFEEQDNTQPQGNWTHNGSGGGWSNAAGEFHTGRIGFNLSPARTMTKNSLPAGKYVVSAWHKDGSFVVNGTTVSTSTGGQWLYAEKEITLASPGNITVSSGGSDWGQFIDELRLNPADALMRTFSYDDRSLNLLSVADENSIPAHYEYDNSQRLQVIRDQDRNILQTYEYNYQVAGTALNDIKARTALISGQTTVSQVNALTGANVRRIFQFMDGLGRPVQTNEVAQSPTSKDIIGYQTYDAFGRDVKQYIPYTITSNGGTYRASASSEQLSFANTYGAGGYGYAEALFEASPLNRPLEKAAPGDTWRIGNGHTMDYVYRGNTTTDAVRNFSGSSNFAVNLLWVTQETDENERKKWTFTDKLGRVVLVKQELNAGETAQTYTVYDDFGRVLCVIPPETSNRMVTSGNWDYNHTNYASMIFKYAYDSRGRMTSKTIPSGGTTTIAYDRLDRPVLSADAKGFKVFTRYDILSRPVVSGKYKGTGSPGASDPFRLAWSSTPLS